MYWVDAGTKKIQRANLDGTNIEDLVTTGLVQPTDIAIDTQRGKMYWTDAGPIGEPGNGKIQRANLDGSNVEDLLTNLTSPQGIALDVEAGTIYWTDAGRAGQNDGAIHRADLLGSGVQTLIADLAVPWGIDLDLASEHIYWTDDAGIRRASLDGSGLERVLPEHRLIRISLDVPGRKIYFSGFAIDVPFIARSDLDGANDETLYWMEMFAPAPAGLAVHADAGLLYWTGWFSADADALIFAGKTDGSSFGGIVGGLANPGGIALALEGPPSIPTLSGWGLFVGALLLLLAGSKVITRRFAHSDKTVSSNGRADCLSRTHRKPIEERRKFPYWHRLFLPCIFVFSVATTGTQAQSAPEIFESAGGETAGDGAEGGLVVRSRPVYVAFEHLNDLNVGDSRTFNLFDDAVFIGNFDRREVRSASSYSWTGRIEAEEGRWFVLSVESDVCLANVWVPSAGAYQVRYGDEDVHLAQEIDLSALPGCGLSSEDVSFSSPPTANAPSCPECAVDDGSLIHMLVAYTPAARIAEGGTKAITALIRNAEMLTNSAFEDSSVATRVSVISITGVGYAESGNMRLDLERLVDPSDGHMDILQARRNAIGADIVSLILNGDGPLHLNPCGIVAHERFCSGFSQVFRFSVHQGEQGVPEGFDRIGFNVVKRSCAVTDLAFTHELGHNFGCRHERAQDPAVGAFPYSHGYIDVLECGGSFRTIMAVQNLAPLVPYFSNPDLEWPDCGLRQEDCPPEFLNCPLGIGLEDEENAAHNALSMNNVASLVANFRTFDCNRNGLMDLCDISCDSAFGCDVPGCGQSRDCNSNGFPDDCEPFEDCNSNGILDICDIADGNGGDCNSNWVPDECEPFADCNGNGVRDICDIASGFSADCNANSIPDECETLIDCNENGVPDACEVESGEIPDCNDNGVPDECDIASGDSEDTNDNGVPDECEAGPCCRLGITSCFPFTGLQCNALCGIFLGPGPCEGSGGGGIACYFCDNSCDVTHSATCCSAFGGGDFEQTCDPRGICVIPLPRPVPADAGFGPCDFHEDCPSGLSGGGCVDGVCAVNKNRYLSIWPGRAGQTQARLTSAPMLETIRELFTQPCEPMRPSVHNRRGSKISISPPWPGRIPRGLG